MEHDLRTAVVPVLVVTLNRSRQLYHVYGGQKFISLFNWKYI